MARTNSSGVSDRPASTLLGEFLVAADEKRAIIQSVATRGFTTRQTDIFIATFPKSGTVWMQQIVHGLRTHGSMEFDDISKVVPFFEMALHAGRLDATPAPEPRAFKTHLAWDLVPKGARYIYLIRDPGDALVSRYHYVNGSHFERAAMSIDEFARDIFMSERANPFGRYWHHLRSWWPLHDDERALFVCYEDLKQDLAGEIARVARFMGLGADAASLELVTRQASFEYMKQHASKFNGNGMAKAWDSLALKTAQRLPPSAQTWIKIRSGRVGDHAVELSVETREALASMWKREIGALGFATYGELRTYLASRVSHGKGCDA